jgi:hypothetical protein
MINNKITQTKEEKKLLEEHHKKMRLKALENGLSESNSRARSVVVGTAFGGCSEISLRRPDGTVTFAILQPVEMVELINQMAANIGCYVLLKPREDFAAWRQWKHTPQELDHFRGMQPLPGVGHPPHAKAIEPIKQEKLPPPQEQPGMPLPEIQEPSEPSEQAKVLEKNSKQRKNKKSLETKAPLQNN